jgi:hypothetical protein
MVRDYSREEPEERHDMIAGEENVHLKAGTSFRKAPIKSVTAGHASGGGGGAHGFGHSVAQRDGFLRNSGMKGAHRLGRSRGR